MTTELPRGVTSLVKRLAPGWTHRVITGTGHVTKLHNDPDTRKQLTLVRSCTSISLRARHHDGRAAVGVWLRPDGAKTFTFEGGWRWHVCRDQACPKAGIDHPGETPTQIDSATLGAWLGALDLSEYERTAAEIEQRKQAATAKAAATRAAKRATGTDLSTSVATEEAA